MTGRQPPPVQQSRWHRLRSALKVRRIAQVGLLGAAGFLLAYVDPQTTLLRILWALAAAALLFTQAPVLLGPLWRRRRAAAGAAIPGSGRGADQPARPGPGLRSRFRQRWPHLSGWLPGFRPGRPADLPARLPVFRGRAAELAELERVLLARSGRSPDRRRRRRLRLVRRPAGPERPLIVLLQGMPGVGKSALAQEAAHRVARRYPHGQLYANLGIGGTSRPAGEVLKEFLIALGWPENAIPADTETRGKIYRSLTRHRRLLVVLDAARDFSQVRELLPNGHQQAVIITGRRDLGPELGATVLTLTPPSTGDALAMLRAITGTGDGEAPVHAVAIVRRCGRLPRALWAAGARAMTEPQRLAAVARRIWSDIDLLDYLTYDGVNLSADFEAEYARLLPREQEALRLLTLIESPTFVPWVLCPLLGVDLSEAENLVTRLGAAHLLEVAGTSTTSGTARYGYHPLVRTYATAKRDHPDDRQPVSLARRRVYAAYRGVVRDVLQRIGEPVPPGTPQEARWLPPEFIREQIAEYPEWWVRTEHANLTRCASMAADTEEYGLCWRVGRWLGECIPLGADPAAILEALTISRVAAEQDGSTEGVLGVQLASAGVLAATDRHADAGEIIASTVERAAARRLPELAAIGHRRHAEALLQIGAYQAAAGALRSARQFTEPAHPYPDPAHPYPNSASRAMLDGGGEAMLIAVLDHLCRGFQLPQQWRDDLPDEALPAWHDRAHFHAHLARAQVAWRRCDWQTASDQLEQALDANRDDGCRVAVVEYHQARLCLAQVRAASTAGQRVAAGLHAVERAAEALLTFRGMHNRVGELRARCLLARALVVTGQLVEAGRQVDKALAALRTVAPPAGPLAAELLHAAVDNAIGEVRLWEAASRVPEQRVAAGLRASRLGEAIRAFGHAGSIFLTHGDWWSAADCDLGLGRAHRRAGDGPAAMAALWRAAASFGQARDVTSHRASLTELIGTARDMDHHGAAQDLRRLRDGSAQPGAADGRTRSAARD